jgi:hypothetical protein
MNSEIMARKVIITITNPTNHTDKRNHEVIIRIKWLV